MLPDDAAVRHFGIPDEITLDPDAFPPDPPMTEQELEMLDATIGAEIRAEFARLHDETIEMLRPPTESRSGNSAA